MSTIYLKDHNQINRIIILLSTKVFGNYVSIHRYIVDTYIMIVLSKCYYVPVDGNIFSKNVCAA